MISGFITGFDSSTAWIEQADRTSVKIKKDLLPAFARKGDFVYEEKGKERLSIDFSITEKRRQEILRMADMLFE